MAKGNETANSQLDELDRKIAECVIQNSRVAVRGIVAQLNELQIKVSESTVQKRLADMLNEGRLERIMIVRDWVAAGYPFRYRVNVKADMKELRLGRGGPPEDNQAIKSQKELAAYIKEVLARHYKGRLVVLDVRILLGYEADLSVTVRTKDPRTILDFVTEGLRVLGGVEATMTSSELWTYGEPQQT